MERVSSHRGWRTARRTVTVLLLLYLFLVGIRLLGAGLNLFGQGFADQLIATTSSPVVGLFVGILITSIVQSSSVTTSLVVGAVGQGTISVANAVPIVMGANIGTTVTSLLISFGCASRREEFRRAMRCATVHDFFNLLTVIVLLPIELATGYLRWAGTRLAGLFSGAEGVEQFHSPLKTACTPLVKLISGLVKSLTSSLFGEEFGKDIGSPIAATITVVLAVALILWTLFTIVRVLRSASAARLGVIFDRFIGTGGIIGILLGLGVTVVVQSSSMTLSLCVPMAAAGIVTIEQVFAVTLGANLGTTITGILAALATGSVSALAIALVHTLFNVTGILVFFPLKPMRRIPLALAHWFSGVGSRSRWIAVLYLVGMFFLLPVICVLLGRLL